VDVVAEFEAQLAGWRAEYAGRPDEELIRLWSVALEREQLVTVSYRRELVADRLRRMGVETPIVDVITRAVAWIRRDEETHARFVRGALIRTEARPGRVRAYLTQLGGTVAGWTASRQQNLRWSEAPLVRAAAEAVEVAGVAVGKIPPAARETLRFATFAEWCRFNVAAEATAALGWARMAEVGVEAGLPDDEIHAYRHIEADERRHAAIFGLLADRFDAADRATSGWSADELAAEIGRVGQRFLATPRPGAPAWDNPLGKGAPVFVVGDAPAGPRTAASATDTLYDRLGVDALAAERRPAGRPLRVAIAASFMLAARRDDPSGWVDPAVVRALVERLRRHGAVVSVLEGRNPYDRFVAHRDVASVARYVGFEDPGWTVVDTALDQEPHGFARGLGPGTVSAAWRDADLRILVGKLRSHPVSSIMGALDVAEALVGRFDRFVFAERPADRATATLMALDACPPDVAVVEAWEHVPDGLLGMLGTDDPRAPRRIYGSRDAVALDLALLRHTGGAPSDHDTVDGALDWFGDPEEGARVVGEDRPIPGWRRPDGTLVGALLARLSEPVYMHASGHGAAFLPRFDDAAFPPLYAETPPLRLARALVRSLLTTSPPTSSDLLPARSEHVDERRVRVARGGRGPAVVLLHGYPDDLHVGARSPLICPATTTSWRSIGPGSARARCVRGRAGPTPGRCSCGGCSITWASTAPCSSAPTWAARRRCTLRRSSRIGWRVWSS
jgi:uncharacterized protein (DUF362 family)